jgi:hypothetical protein
LNFLKETSQKVLFIKLFFFSTTTTEATTMPNTFSSVFGIVVALWLWFEKSIFIKSVFSCGWFGKIYVWLKLWLKLRLNKK